VLGQKPTVQIKYRNGNAIETTDAVMSHFDEDIGYWVLSLSIIQEHWNTTVPKYVVTGKSLARFNCFIK